MLDTSVYDKMMKLEQRKKSKLWNAEKKKLKGLARDIYLLGIASLSRCEEVAQKGNSGRGYKLPVIVSEDRKNNKKPGKKNKGKNSGDQLSLVEFSLWERAVAGSNPASPTKLGYGVMVTLQILILSFEVRVLVPQPNLPVVQLDRTTAF